MPVDLQSGIVRILSPSGSTAGTGFVVTADGLIVTCSHVVQSVDAQLRGDPPPETVRIAFAANGEERNARVDPDCWVPREQGDVAILRLEGDLPEGAEVLPLGAAAESTGHTFRTRGFRDNGERAGAGEILDLVMVTRGREALQLRSQEVTRGFSGAPVWDVETELVVGMVSDIAPPDQHGRGRDTAFATTSEVLGHTCPDLQIAPVSAISRGLRTRRRLSVPIDPFVGRQRLVAEIVDRLGRPEIRLLTLTGTGGVGKTRLALEVGLQVENGYLDGACLVDLSALTDPTLVPSAIMQALGVREEGTLTAVEQVQDFLADKRLLLVLDNFERLLEAGPIVARLLRASPGLTVLTTSRSPLRIAGEQEFPVEPMELSNFADLPPLDELAHNEAVELFVRRAQAVLPDFALTAENAEAVAEICVRLDGLPLAIELAAARLRLFPDPAALLRRLEPRLPMLVGGPRDAPERQRTMRDAIAWSYELLSPAEQALFRRIGIFVGRFDIEAAAAVIHGAGTLDLDAVAGVEILFLSSLLQPKKARRGEPTFLVLETLREFALDELDRHGETEATRTAHAGYCLALAEAAEPHLKGSAQREWVITLEDTHDEIRAALIWFIESMDFDSATRLAAALGWFWQIRGHHTEGRMWFDRVLTATASLSPRLLAKALEAAGHLAFLQGDYQHAWSFHSQVLTLRRELRDRQGVAAALTNLATVLSAKREHEGAKALYLEALPLMREAGDEHSVGSILTNLGTLALNEGDATSAAEIQTENVGLMRRLGDTRGLAIALNGLGTAELSRKNILQAAEAFQEMLALGQELGDPLVIATAMHNQGDVAREQ